MLLRTQGRGEGTRTEPGQAAPVRLKRVNADLNEELHSQFKAVCAKEKRQMSEVIRELIEDWTKKHE